VSNADDARLRGNAAAEDGNRRHEEALKQCDAEIRRNPHLAEAHCRRAMVLQSLRRFDEALQSLDRAIQLRPRDAETYFRKANLLGSLRRLEEAVASYDRALACRPDHAPAWHNRAGALQALRRFDDALRSCDKAIAFQPGHADAHLHRGNLLMGLGRPGDALESYERAIAAKSDLVEAQYNRSHALRRLGRLSEALDSFDRTIALKAGFAEAHLGRGNTLADLNRPDEAVRSFDRAIALKPDLAEAHNNRGMALHRLGRFEEALESYSQAIALRSGYALAFNNRGTALREIGRLEDALRDCTRAVALNPRFAEAHYNRGNVLKDLKRPNEALHDYDCAIALKPDLAESHWNKAVCTLLMGRFEEGWRLYERRKRKPDHDANLLATQTAWSGAESLEGKSLYIQAEQGLGDTIQFCRYALLAAEMGQEVVLAVQDPLVRLMKSLGRAIHIRKLTSGAPAFDYYVPLLSMPLAFHTAADSIPAEIPYLSAESERIRHWNARIGSEGFRVGICWQGAKGGEVDIGRSLPVRHFEGIARIPGVRLISLQKNAGAEQLLDLPAGMEVETLGDDFDAGPDAFIDTAAIMENLDLVVTSDTAVAHLAGALGRPVWVALSYVPDWRWHLDCCDSPWYPTMKLFRQTERGNWRSIFAAMEMRLLEMLRADQSHP
jgi:tetratricopeptide (TPR) repeat protein